MRKLSPKAVWLFFFQNYGVLWLAALAVFVFWIFNPGYFSPQIGGQKIGLGSGFDFAGQFVIVLGFLISVLLAWLNYRFYRWDLTETGLKIEHGIIIKSSVVIPYEKIQNVNIERSLWELVFGLSLVNVETAGFSSVQAGGRRDPEGVLPGLDKSVAEEVRQELLKRSQNISQNKLK